ncbi:MAG: N-acetyltransferase family protein [Candidatus Limnocylindria bacterium]
MPDADPDLDLPLDVKPLTPDRLPDLAALFEQGGDPRWCWCAYFRVRSTDFSRASRTRHRGVMERAVADLAPDRAPGLVAYRDDEAVGWVSVGPRTDYERLAYSRVLAPVDDTPVWSVVCFVVGRRARGQGVATALLAAAIAFARDHGATTLEAYPVDLDTGERIASANAYGGTLAMFEGAGFEVVARRKANSATRERPIVRLTL